MDVLMRSNICKITIRRMGFCLGRLCCFEGCQLPCYELTDDQTGPYGQEPWGPLASSPQETERCWEPMSDSEAHPPLAVIMAAVMWDTLSLRPSGSRGVRIPDPQN